MSEEYGVYRIHFDTIDGSKISIGVSDDPLRLRIEHSGRIYGLQSISLSLKEAESIKDALVFLFDRRKREFK